MKFNTNDKVKLSNEFLETINHQTNKYFNIDNIGIVIKHKMSNNQHSIDLYSVKFNESNDNVNSIQWRDFELELVKK